MQTRVVTAGVLLAAGLFGGSSSAWAQGGGASPVVVAVVQEREVASGQTFVGTVMPLKRSSVGSAVDGRVVEFPVNEGDRVEKGQALAQLLTETIRLQTEAAEAELELRKAELAELENGSRPEEVEQAQARMLGAKALMDYSTAKLKRTRTLFETGRAITEDQLQEALSLATNAEQTWREAKAAHDLAVQGPRHEKIGQARARVASQQALVDQLKDQFKKHTMIAPFDGYVVAEHTEVGQWVSRGELVAEVVALDEVDIVAHVLESQIPFVRVGMEARVEVPSVPNRTFTGRVALIVPQADVRARTFPVKIRVENPLEEGTPLLKAGMLGRVTLPTGATQQALLLPKDALVLGGPTPLVYVVTADPKQPKQGKVHPVSVELGVSSGTLIQVRGNLEEGQQVVVQGNERLRPGQDVLVTRIQTEAGTAAPQSNVPVLE